MKSALVISLIILTLTTFGQDKYSFIDFNNLTGIAKTEYEIRKPNESKQMTIEYKELNAEISEVFYFSILTDSVYINKRPQKHELFGKGTWDLRFSLPCINHFILKPVGEKDISSIGFWGAAIGFDYYHRNTQYLSMIIGGVMDYPIPVPVGIDYEYGEQIVEYDDCYSKFIGLANNHRYRFFSLGYGLSYSQNTWRRTYRGGYLPDGSLSEIPPTKKYMDNTLGLIFTVCYTYQFSKNSLSLGIIYRPTHIRLNANPIFEYEHLLSIDFAWRIRLKTVAKPK